MRRKGPPHCRPKISVALAMFAVGLIVSYLLPTAWVIFLLAIGLLTLAICQIRR